MIETNNPEIDVDCLMQQVWDEVAKRSDFYPPTDGKPARVTTEALAIFNTIKALLDSAESKSQVRTEIPKKFARFPLNLSKGLQKFALKVYAFLFKEQRAINFSLIQALRESLALNQQLLERATALHSQLQQTSDRLAAMDERSLRNDSYLKNDLTQQKRLLTEFLEQARQRLPHPFNAEQLQGFVREEPHLADAFYTAFEDQFRGSREAVANTLKVYLPLIEEAKIGTPESPILDVGCGRGEWLELLRESGYVATGLDVNRVMVDYCQTRGLEVVEGDAIAYLQALPNSSLGAISGFHIIEHLSFPVLQRFFSEAIGALKPGGLVIFETPNPKNLVVGACNFYSDPTHRNPLFPETVQFILESQGLSDVRILYLNPVEGSPFDRDDAGSQMLHNWFFGPRDYAVVGRKL